MSALKIDMKAIFSLTVTKKGKLLTKKQKAKSTTVTKGKIFLKEMKALKLEYQIDNLSIKLYSLKTRKSRFGRNCWHVTKTI